MKIVLFVITAFLILNITACGLGKLFGVGSRLLAGSGDGLDVGDHLLDGA